MKHLSRDRLLDVAEGTVPPPAHLDECRACAERAEKLRGVLAEARRDAVPEPSPLFWEHLSRRVSEAVARERSADSAVTSADRAQSARWRRTFRLLVPAGVAGCALALLLTALEHPPVAPPRPSAGPAVAHLPGATQAIAADVAVENDGAWSALTDLVDAETDEDGNAAVQVPDAPGSAEAAAQRLSGEEQDELLRLLRIATTPHGTSRGEG